MNKKINVLGVIILSISVIILTSSPPGSRDSRAYPGISKPGVGSMIVITTAEFQPAVEPLVKWKNRKGIRTRLYIYPGDTGPAPADIKAFIKKIYDSPESLTYVLLVGDAEDVPPAIGTAADSKGQPSDLIYTLLAGDDEYADVMIGRFSVENLTQAQTVVNKNLWYEMNPDPNGEWYRKAMGIAGDDRYFTPHQREIMVEIQELMTAYHYTEFTTIYSPEAKSLQVSEAINQGRGWINAAEHGWVNGWPELHFVIPHVKNLKNTRMTPVIIATSCLVGDFAGKTCFAETWQRLGTPQEPQGSIVFLGYSGVIWNFAWIGHQEIIRLLVNENYFTAGEIIFNGVMKFMERFPHGPRYEGLEVFQRWHLFGDPSLFVYTDTPTEMKVTYKDTLPIGSEGFVVKVTAGEGAIKKALVALYMDKLYGSAYTDQSGIANIVFSEPVQETGKMEVNVTAYNKMPYFGTVTVK